MTGKANGKISFEEWRRQPAPVGTILDADRLAASGVRRSVGKAVRSWRQHSGYSTAELANVAGLSRVLIRSIENDQRSPRTETLIRLADAMSITLGQLLDGAPSATA